MAQTVGAARALVRPHFLDCAGTTALILELRLNTKKSGEASPQRVSSVRAADHTSSQSISQVV